MSRLVHVCLLDFEKDKMTLVKHEAIETSFKHCGNTLKSDCWCVRVKDVRRANENDLVEAIKQADMLGLCGETRPSAS